MGRQKPGKPKKTRGICAVCKVHGIRICLRCGRHVYWVRLLTGGDGPVGAHDGTLCCG